MKKMVVKILGAALLLGALFLPNAFASVNPKATSWTPLTPPTRDCFQTEVVDGKIYIFGRKLSKSYSVKDTIIYDTEVDDPSTHTWSTLAPMPTARLGFWTEVVDGKLYVIGGGNGEDTLCPEGLDGKLTSTGSENNEVIGVTEVYDPSTDTWTTLASMPTYYADFYTNFNTEVVDGKIYTMGIDMDKKAYLEVYNPSTDTWTMLSSMPTARDCFETEVVDGKIYAIGGYNTDFKQLFSIEAYDTSTDTWTMLPSMPTTRSNFQTEVVDGKIYAIGGGDSDFKPLKSTEVYDPSKDTWTTLAPTENFIGDTAVIGKTIYGIGRDSDGITMEAYTVNANDKNKQK